VEPFRARLLDRRLALGAVVAVALFAPHGLWLTGHWEEAREYVLQYSQVARENGGRKGALVGIRNLAWSLALAVAGPAVGAVAFPPMGLRGGGEESGAPRPCSRGDEQAAANRLLAWSFLLALGLLVVLVAAGVRGYRTHWFAPFLLLLPVW